MSKSILLLPLLAVFLTILVAQSDAACLHPNCNTCGNGVCERGENTCLCPEDCKGCCPDGICHIEHGETAKNCPHDCGTKLTVRVVHALTGAPLNQSTVTCYHQSDLTYGPVDTASHNYYEWEPVDHGKWTCEATKSGFYPNWEIGHLSSPACWSEEEIVIPLKPKCLCIHGLVTDLYTEEVISGASVTCGTPAKTLPNQVTDVNGIFFFEEVPVGLVTCQASHPDYLTNMTTLTYKIDDCNPNRIHHVKLTPAPGIVDVRVSLNFSCRDDDYDRKNWTIKNTVITCQDSHGVTFTANGINATFSRVHPGLVKCQTSNVNRYPSEGWGILTPAGHLTLNLVLKLFYGNLTGNVVDGRTGKGIKNTEISCLSPYHWGSGASDRNGNYLIPFLLNGTFSCLASAEGYFDGYLDKVILDNETSTLNFVLLPKESSISGKIFSYPYDGIGNVTIECVLENHKDQIQISRNISSSNGNFIVGDLYGYGSLGCTFTKSGYGVVGRYYEIRSGTKISCDIPLSASPTPSD